MVRGAKQMVLLTKLGCPAIKSRKGPGGERDRKVASRWRKLLMGLWSVSTKSSSTRHHTSSREGAADGKPVRGFDANGPCAWSGRTPRMVVASGDLAVHWSLAALSGVVASRAPRQVRRTLVEGACEAARLGNRSRRFLLRASPRSSVQWPRHRGEPCSKRRDS